MPRLKGVEPREAGWFTRLIYWLARRKVGKLTGKHELPEPIKVLGHHPRLLRATGQMELGQDAAKTVELQLKTLAQVKAATLVGCPY